VRRIAAIVAVLGLAAVAHGRPKPVERPYPAESPSLRALPNPPSIASGDTVWYGGTTWMPDSMRWEAVRDSVWTFDTGVGSSINTGQNPNKPIGYHETMEGWFGLDLWIPITIPENYFRRSSICAINGSWSAWAGVTQVEAESLCYATGQGYGNSWNMTLGKVFNYPGSGTVTLGYAYAVECEAGFDYAYVIVDTTGATDPSNAPGSDTIKIYTGSVSGTESIVLQPGFTMRSTPGPFSIWFTAASDGLYSDEDGLNPTICGHSAFDDITLSGAVNDVSDFEASDDGWAAWSPAVPTVAEGDFSNLADLADLPIPGGLGPCSVQDSVLVFATPAMGHSVFQANIAVSPWIDLSRGGDEGRTGRILAVDLMTNLPRLDFVYVTAKARWYPSQTCSGGMQGTVSSFSDLGYVYYFGEDPFCTSAQPYQLDFSSVIPPVARQVQIAWGIINYCSLNPDFFCTGMTNTTPYFDNIRFGVFGAQSGTAEPEAPPVTRLEAATPNPLRASTTIAFTLERSGPVSLAILDVAGRLVRTLIDAERAEGPDHIDWDGRDESGRSVPDGLYFYRLTADGRSTARKVMVLR